LLCTRRKKRGAGEGKEEQRRAGRKGRVIESVSVGGRRGEEGT
jgi:hypothetical protein